MAKKTALYQEHQALGARIIEFGGWAMPVFYTSIVDEHQTVRRSAGIFDISHMGEFMVTGPGAQAFLNHLLTNDASNLTSGQGQYSILCLDNGGTIDDLYLYRLAQESFMLIVNASRIEADWRWVSEKHQIWAGPRVEIEDKSGQYSAVAVQGPTASLILDACFGESNTGTHVDRPSELSRNELGQFTWSEGEVWIARTGYTGEDGFEIVASNQSIATLWRKLLTAGHPHRLQPAGLGARDTLRTEMGYPLYGHELSEDTTPLECGMGFAVKLTKDDFIGKQALESSKSAGLKRRLIAFKMTGKSAPPREGYPLWRDQGASAPVGKVTSGTQSPSLATGIGLAYVSDLSLKPGDPIEIEIRKRRFPAEVVKKPILQSTRKSLT